MSETTPYVSEHISQERVRLTHSDLSVDMNYDEKIDTYDTTEFFQYLNDHGHELISSLPKKKDKKVLPDLQVLSKFFLFCKEKFKGIPAMVIFDELTDYLEINPKDMLDNLSKPIKNQLIKELKKRISLDKYNKKIKQEFVSRNGAIQPSLDSATHTQNF